MWTKHMDWYFFSGTRSKVGKLKLVYALPEPVRKAGLSTVSVELPYDSAMALSKDNLNKALEEMVDTHVHLKLSVSYNSKFNLMLIVLLTEQ